MLRKHLVVKEHVDPSSISLVAPVGDFLKKTFALEPEASEK